MPLPHLDMLGRAALRTCSLSPPSSCSPPLLSLAPNHAHCVRFFSGSPCKRRSFRSQLVSAALVDEDTSCFAFLCSEVPHHPWLTREHGMHPCRLLRIRVVHVCALSRSQNFKLKSKLQNQSNEYLDWWKEKMNLLGKPVSKELTKRLDYSNLLGLDENLKNGSFREGSLNSELLEVKTKFPKEVLLCRVGEFYEAIGFDACVLVEYAALNPMSGTRNDNIPRAGCPIMNLRQTLDALTSAGFSVCVYEEVKAPSQGRQRKDRFVSGHAHPGSPYVYGLAEANIDLDIVEEVFVVGISRSARGFCLISISEMMRTISVEDGLTEEAVVTKLRSKACNHVFLHQSLQDNSSGVFRWGEHGEGGLLWAECKGKSCEWFGHDPVKELVSKVKHLYDLEPKEEFREVKIFSTGRPRPLHLGTASQIGVLPTVGVPSLLKVLLPKDYSHLCYVYFRNLLLNPPPPDIASSIQAACSLMAKVATAIPEFTCVSAAKLVKLINSKEANHIEFSRIRSLAEDVIHMYKDKQLREILIYLLDPTYLATGLKVELQQLVNDCIFIKEQLDNILAQEDDPAQKFSNFSCIPDDFFHCMESSWKGRVRQEVASGFYDDVHRAAKELNAAVENEFLPIVMYVRATDGTGAGVPKAEIMFSRECESVWLKLRNFSASGMMIDQENLFKPLIPATDARGKRVRDDIYTTSKIEVAIDRYKVSVLNASCKVYEILRNLAEKLKGNLNIIVFISVLAVIAKTLFAHVSEARRRSWTLPEILNNQPMINLKVQQLDLAIDYSNASENHDRKPELVLNDLIPYWVDRSHNIAVSNSVTMNSLHLLTGPNGGGKSSILRSIGAAALLGICGLMVPAGYAAIPRFDSVMLRMMPQDSPADGKSSFQMEMSELRTILLEVTDKSLVLIDELCRGTEVQKGTAISASVIEFLDSIGCFGVLSTHLHGLLDMDLNVKRLIHKAMCTEVVDGVLVPTWKIKDGCCRESLAFETARNEGVPEVIIARAQQLHALYHHTINFLDKPGITFEDVAVERKISKEEILEDNDSHECFVMDSCKQIASGSDPSVSFKIFRQQEEAETRCQRVDQAAEIFSTKCKMKILEQRWIPCETDITFIHIGTRENPPPAATNRSCVYFMSRPDGRFYVGQTDDIAGRIKAHRRNLSLRKAPFLYVHVPNKSIATELETFLINELPRSGIQLVNKADQNHRHFGTVETSLYSELPF